MKKLKVGLMALSVLAGGMMAASAATSGPNSGQYNSYDIFMSWQNPTNSSLGVDSAAVWSADSGPNTDPLVLPHLDASDVNVSVDGAGKLSGAGWLYIDYSSNSYPFGAFLVEVSGNITKGAKVSMTVKGNGYTIWDATGTNADTATINVKFTGTGPTGPGTNRIAGTLSGSVNGNTPQGSKNFKFSNTACYIDAFKFFFSLNATALANAKKIQVYGSVGEGGLFTALNGTISKGSPAPYKFNAKGIGDAKGANFTVSGNLTKLVTNLVVIGTNPPVEVIVITPGTANLKGKAIGQDVSGAALDIEVFN